MRTFKIFVNGDRVRLKTGLLAGREGVVVRAALRASAGNPWRLVVKATSFDGSKVFVRLKGSDVESL